MCGHVVCMAGTVRWGGGAFSPLPSATRSRRVVADLDEEMAFGVDDAQMRGHRLAAEGQRAKGESAALRRVSRDLRIEAHQLGAQGDGGSVLALPSPRLDLEEVRESRVERLRILAVHLRVLDLALLGE